jgi:hypothetical protein
MPNLWIDLPVHDPIARFAGRMPMLEPLFLYAGAGFGGAQIEVSSTDGFASGSRETSETTWQAGAGIGYAFNEWATFSLGYRYQDLGQVTVPLSFQPGVVFGEQTLDLALDEFSATLRIDFYTTPLEDLNPVNWRMPDSLTRRPAWLSRATGWLPGR